MFDPVTMAAAGGGLASIIGGFIGARSAKKAAKAQLQAQREQMELVREGQGKAEGLLGFGAQYRPALQQLMNLNGLGGGQAQQDAYGAFQQSPAYQFNFEQGMGGLNRSAAAKGGSMSGRTLMDAQKFGQGLASNEFGGYYSRLNDLYGSQLGTARNLAGSYTGTAASLADIAGKGGDARANGYINSGNAWTGALQGVANAASYGLGGFEGQRDPTQSSYRRGM
jgi:hypothetical protein